MLSLKQNNQKKWWTKIRFKTACSTGASPLHLQFNKALIRPYSLQAGEKSSECDQTCSYNLAAAFRLGPWCYTTCPNAVVYWDSFWSALMLECAQSKALAVKASQRLSVGKSAAALSWPLFALVSASAGLRDNYGPSQRQVSISVSGAGAPDNARAASVVWRRPSETHRFLLKIILLHRCRSLVVHGRFLPL